MILLFLLQQSYFLNRHFIHIAINLNWRSIPICIKEMVFDLFLFLHYTGSSVWHWILTEMWIESMEMASTPLTLKWWRADSNDTYSSFTITVLLIFLYSPKLFKCINCPAAVVLSKHQVLSSFQYRCQYCARIWYYNNIYFILYFAESK